MLYPLKFNPLFEERIWGGDQLRRKMDKKLPEGKLIGESWELSAVPGNVSVVANGKLAGNSLEELIEVYMGELVGDKIYNKFGLLFPLLIKLIDAQDALSIQVHPNDKLALERHNSYGKTEMWYVIDSEKDAELCLGFNRPVTKEEYLRHVADGTLADILARVPVKPDNAYFIPAGAIHAIGKGILIAEIQQTSDITYRVFDWNRVDKNGKGRELHTDLAADAINFAPDQHYDVTHKPEMNRSVNLVECLHDPRRKPHVEMERRQRNRRQRRNHPHPGLHRAGHPRRRGETAGDLHRLAVTIGTCPQSGFTAYYERRRSFGLRLRFALSYRIVRKYFTAAHPTPTLDRL